VLPSIEIATDDYGRWPAADRPVGRSKRSHRSHLGIGDEVVVGEVEAIPRSSLLVRLLRPREFERVPVFGFAPSAARS
jgi:hypothetical protein